MTSEKVADVRVLGTLQARNTVVPAPAPPAFRPAAIPPARPVPFHTAGRGEPSADDTPEALVSCPSGPLVTSLARSYGLYYPTGMAAFAPPILLPVSTAAGLTVPGLPTASANIFQRIIRNPRPDSPHARERECTEMLAAVLLNALALSRHLFRWMDRSPA